MIESFETYVVEREDDTGIIYDNLACLLEDLLTCHRRKEMIKDNCYVAVLGIHHAINELDNDCADVRIIYDDCSRISRLILYPNTIHEREIVIPEDCKTHLICEAECEDY